MGIRQQPDRHLMTRCARCPRTAPDGQHLCLVHSGELRGWLAELPAQARLLPRFLVSSGGPAEGRSGGRAHAPVPVDLRVLVLLGPGHLDPPAGTPPEGDVPITVLLSGWAGYIAYTYPALGWHPDRDQSATIYIGAGEQAVPRNGRTVDGWCAWLTAYLPYALTHPWAADLHRQIGDLVRHLRSLTHDQPRDHPKAAPCPSCDMYGLVRTDGRWHIHCRTCGHQLDPADYDRHAADVLAEQQAG